MFTTSSNTFLSVTDSFISGHFTVWINTAQEQWFKLKKAIKLTAVSSMN